MRRSFLWFTSFLASSGCSRLDSIPHSPKQTAEGWLEIQPFVDIGIGSKNLILVQPSSTIFVYLLGALTIGVGAHFLRIRGKHRSRTWWGIALLLWGLGALSAGTSYQAFSYEIKCAGRELCSWTSWWEVVYLMLSMASVNAMMMAEAYSCSAGRWRKRISLFALASIALYVVVVLIGALVPVKVLMSYELLICFAAPNILFFLALNGWRYRTFRDEMDLALSGAWIWLGITLGMYFLYLALGITHVLWAEGVWFSENDVLHIGLIGWMIYIALIVANRVVDLPWGILHSAPRETEMGRRVGGRGEGR